MPNNTHNIELRSEEVQEILTAVPHWMIRWGNVLFLALILMLLSISYLIKYPDTITTKVMITTSFPPEKIYAHSSGQFDVILMNDNDTIEKNQPIAVIKNSAYYKDVFLLKRIMNIQPKDHQHFTFPIESLPPLNLGEIATSFAEFETNYSEYTLNNQYTPYNIESFAGQMSLIEAKSRLEILNTQKKLNLEELILKEKNLDRHKQLFELGSLSAEEYEQNQLDFIQAKRAFHTIEASLSQMKTLIADTQKKLSSNSVKKVQNKTRLFNKLIQSYYQLEKSIKDWEKLYLIQSSIKGKLCFLSYWNENQTVEQGKLVFTIIPSDNISFIGKILAPPTNSGKIKIGQVVQINLANYPSGEFGEINGIIKSISLLPDEEGNYLIDVQLPDTLKTTYGKIIEFKQEMKGTAEIITEDLRLIERFFYQLKKVF